MDINTIGYKKPTPFVKTCSVCGSLFKTMDENEDTCLVCRVIGDMKLPSDTIINRNMLNIWESGKYDKKKGLPMSTIQIAEGVVLLKGKVKVRNHLSGYKNLGAKKESEITDFFEACKKNDNYFDAIVVLRFSHAGDFKVYGFRCSEKLFKKISNLDSLTAKNIISKLVMLNELEK